IRARNVTGVQTCALPILAHALPRVLDLVGDVTHDHRVRHREVASGEDRVDDLLLELTTLVLRAPRLELSAQLGAERGEARELARSEERRVGEGGRYRWAP